LASQPDELGLTTRGLLLVCGVGAAWVAACGGMVPAATGLSLPWPVAPLHSRCLAALHAAAAMTWLLCLRERDQAAVRIPLALVMGSSWSYVLQVFADWPLLAPTGGSAWAWLVVQTVAAALSAWLLFWQREFQAPAEEFDVPLGLFGLLALAMAALLGLKPGWAAGVWPWPLSKQAAVLYAAALSGWALALLMLARERRRGARSLTLLGLAIAGPLVTWAFWLHRDAFYIGALGAAWAALFLLASALAVRRLRSLSLRHRRRAIRGASRTLQ
jgi:hypothetical protein